MHTFTLPSGVEIDLVEMTGIEEDLITSQRLMKNTEAANQVLGSCSKRLGDNDSPDMQDVAAVTESGPDYLTFTLASAPAAGATLKIDYILKPQ